MSECRCRDYWARFERFLNQLTKGCQDVFIVTGPLYLPHKTAAGYEMRHGLIGETDVVVHKKAVHTMAFEEGHRVFTCVILVIESLVG